MRVTALCAFREPFGVSMVEAVYPGQEIEVPAELIARLVAEGHIAEPAPTPGSDADLMINGAPDDRRLGLLVDQPGDILEEASGAAPAQLLSPQRPSRKRN